MRLGMAAYCLVLPDSTSYFICSSGASCMDVWAFELHHYSALHTKENYDRHTKENYAFSHVGITKNNCFLQLQFWLHLSLFLGVGHSWYFFLRGRQLHSCLPVCQFRENIQMQAKGLKVCAGVWSSIHTVYMKCPQTAQLCHQAPPAFALLLTFLMPLDSI